MRVKIFRGKAVGPLLLLLVIIAILIVLFAEPVARQTTEEVSTELLGTQVDVGRLDLLPRKASVDLGALQVADPFEPRRNLIEADRIVLKLNPEALTEKKLVVERFALQGMQVCNSLERIADYQSVADRSGGVEGFIDGGPCF